MKIILGSDLSFLLNYGYNLTGLSKEKMKIGYVNTAAIAARDKEFFVNVKEKIRENGYSFEEIDLQNKKAEELIKFFKDKNVIHVDGGNTYWLLKVIRESGFDKIIKRLLNEGRVYIGTSAGAYVMCPSIEVSNWNVDGKEKFGLTDYTALNFVPFVLKVHYKDEQSDLVSEKVKTLKYPLRILRDGQGIFVDGNKIEFVGAGDEVKVQPTKDNLIA